MHEQARQFTLFVKSILPKFFQNLKVLDVGSGDINGNNRFLFNNCEYHGNDVVAAKNVTIVSKTKDLPFEDNSFDTIISTECFEHDPEYKQSFAKIYKMLKPGGLFCFTCASTGRGEHGTRRTNPRDSYGSSLPDMADHYRNITIQDLNEIVPLKESFQVWDSYYNPGVCDLYFVGIKKGGEENNTIKSYTIPNIKKTSNDV